eukprot:SAG31_NODE_2457_length_5661_cov_94.571557_8_plen_64_part_01
MEGSTGAAVLDSAEVPDGLRVRNERRSSVEHLGVQYYSEADFTLEDSHPPSIRFMLLQTSVLTA